MRHCTLCGIETERGAMMRVHKGPKQFLCEACTERQKSTLAQYRLVTVVAVCIILALGVAGMIISLFLSYLS